MSFIEDFLETYKDAESPTQFFYWSAIASISAALRKNVYINKRIYKLYPNLYIMFVAKSGLRKGYPVKQAQKVVEALELVKVISGRNSIQSIIQELSRQWTTENGNIMKEAQALIVNDELDSLLIEDPAAQTILTTLYDCFYHEKKWTNTLKKDGRENLSNLYISMLTATNPTHLDNFLDKTSSTGGFLGRTLIVYADKRSKINALIEENDATEVDIQPLVDSLRSIANLKGQFKFTTKAVEIYKPWYVDFSRRTESMEIDDDSGTAERAGDTVLRLAMILSANDNSDLLISENHIEKSIELFYNASKDARFVFAGKGKSTDSDRIRTILHYLLNRPGCAAYRKQILSARYGDISANELTEVMETLSQAGLIEIIIDKEEGQLYKVTERLIAKMKARG